jgi:integrase
MLVKLMGMHKVKARLASGETATYHYAWRGGPRINVDPKNKRAFAAEFFRLTRARDEATGKGTLAELVRSYVHSQAFLGLRETTRGGYQAAIDTIEAEFFDLPLSAIAEPGARRLFIEWRDSFAATPRKADMLLTVLARILSYGLDLELVQRNPLEKIGKLSDGTRRDAIWTDEQTAAFKATAHPKLVLALELARWTGQRQGDLLRLTWKAIEGDHIKLRQGKTGALVRIRIHSELRAVLDATKKDAVTILTNSRGGSWTGDGFRASWGKACEAAGVEGVTFHDLRGTFVTLAYRHHGASIREIAEVSGHSERDAEAIIRKHYLAGDAVIERLETGNKPAREV